MGNTTGTKQKPTPNKSKVVAPDGTGDKTEKSINGVKIDQIDDEELIALKQVCLSYIDMIEFVIDSIPEKKENEIEPDFEPVFLELKKCVTSAKRQLGRQEIDSHNKEERTLKLNATEIAALPDLPIEEPPTPSAVKSFSNINFSSSDIHADPPNGSHYSARSSTSSMFSESTTSITTINDKSHNHMHAQQSTMSLAFRKFTGRNTITLEDANERDRIKTEIKVMKKQLKQRKFELLPNKIWSDYLLCYLCRSEQFVLSSTCKYCQKKCGVDSFVFTEQFDLDNMYWRNNFFNFVDPLQDSTILIAENKFELLSNTQKRQLKYYIKFWDKFILERQHRKKLKQNDREHKMDDMEQQMDMNNNEEKKEVLDEQVIELEKEIEEEKKEISLEKEEKKEDDCNEEEEDNDLLDLYGSDNDNFEYDDDRPRGLQLLEKYRSDFAHFHRSGILEDASLHIAIPCDVEQLIIRDCKNRNGELAHWLSSLLCYIPSHCPIDWIGLENNNFQDRDVHRICAGLLNRKKQSNLIGLSLCNNTNITDKAIHILLKTISKKCHKLQFLKLSNCTRLTNKTCQTILDFYAKTYNDDKIQLNYIDLSQNYKINDKGIHILNQIYLHQQYTPYNVVVRFYVAGTMWKDAMDDWSKNIILKPPKRR